MIQAVAREVHRHGKLLHIHFHGRCLDVIADLAEPGSHILGTGAMADKVAEQVLSLVEVPCRS